MAFNSDIDLPQTGIPNYEDIVDRFYSEVERPGKDGQSCVVNPAWAVDRETGLYLNLPVKKHKPRLSLEIGLCQGASAIHLAAGHAANGSGFHLAFDPLQHAFGDCGRISIERFGLSPWFRHASERSDKALPLLYAAGVRVDLIFIDGDHRFDAVFADYYFAEKLLEVGGLLVFDEAGYDCPTKRGNSFVEKNMENCLRLESPARFYVVRKTGIDQRPRGHWMDF